MVEEPRRGVAREVRVDRRVGRVLQPAVLDHAGLERRIAAARDRRTAEARRQRPGVRESVAVERGLVAAEHLRIPHRRRRPAVGAVGVMDSIVRELRGALEVPLHLVDRHDILRRVQRGVVEAAVDIRGEAHHAGDAEAAEAAASTRIRRRAELDRHVDHPVEARLGPVVLRAAPARSEEVAPDAEGVAPDELLRRARDLREVLRAVAAREPGVVGHGRVLAVAPVTGVGLVGGREAPQVRDRLRDQRPVARARHRGQKHGEQQRDDRHDDEQLHDGESAAGCVSRVTVHGVLRRLMAVGFALRTSTLYAALTLIS